MSEQPKRLLVELNGYTDKKPEIWTATITYGQSLTGKPLRYRTNGWSMHEALNRLAKVIKRDGIPLP